MSTHQMGWQPTLYSLGAFASAGVCALVVGLAWRNRSEHAAASFVGLMLAFGGWALVYAIQLGATTRAGQLVWQRAALAIGGAIPTLWFVFTLQYTNRDEWLTRLALAVLAVEPAAFALLTLTNPAHELIWQSATSPPNVPGGVILSFGTGYFVHITYAYLVVTYGLVVLALSYVRASRLYRTQTGLLILGAIPPFAANVLFTVGVDWGPLPALDPTPFVLPVTGVLFGLALYQFDLLARVPVARERALAETVDGVVVLDENGYIVDANPAAQWILDLTFPVEQFVWEVFPGIDDDDDPDLAAVDGMTITPTVDGRQRVYDVTFSELILPGQRIAGYVIGLRDVTSRQAYEQRLEVVNRILRHNLRNKMNVIRGWAEWIEARGTEEQAEAARRITTTADELVDLGEKARSMVTTGGYVDAGGDPTPVDPRAHVVHTLNAFRHDHPRVTFDQTVSSDTWVSLPDADLLDIALRNLVENAIEHNDADHPWVGVTVDRPGNGERVRIRVADNGPGIPTMEREVLENGVETPLHHGSGIGLWLVHWSVTVAGGTVAFDTNDPRGSVVTLTLPAASEPGLTTDRPESRAVETDE